MNIRHWCVAMFLGLAAGCGKDSGGSDSGGPADPPAIIVSETELNWESLAIGTSAPKSVTIQNRGGSDLEITGVTVAAPFKTTFNTLVTLHAGGATTLNVSFAPTSPGDFVETLSISSTDPARPTVTVTCTGGTINDADGDGFDAGFTKGFDCDDTNPAINPAAEEIWYNGIDNDCRCDNKLCSDFDQDDDGFENDDDNTDPTGVPPGGDCSDTNPSMYPGAADTWYDGYDSNCDLANDNDQDGDGYSSSLYTSTGSDCDDLDPVINVDGTESYNGKDDDCDGNTDFQIFGDSAWWISFGTGSGDGLGTGLTSGLLDGDFTSDVVAGAPGYDGTGAIALYTGGSFPAAWAKMDEANVLLSGSPGDDLGVEVSYLSDFGSGGPHLVVGASGYSSDKGYAAVLNASDVFSGATLSEATELRIEGTEAAARVGTALSNDLDLDGDGLDEVMGGTKSGSTYSLWLVAGDTTLSGSQTTSAADAQFSFTGTGLTMFDTFPGGGNDFDGDGYDDFLFCNDSGGDDGFGENWILWGSGTPYSNTEAQALGTDVGTTIATGTSSLGLGFICGSAGDWNDDGKAEVWLYEYNRTDFYVVAGDSSLRDGAVDVASDYLALYHFDGATNDPVEIRDVGDLNDDGTHEIAIALSSEEPGPSTTPGQLFIFGSDLGFGEVSTSVEYVSQALFWGDKDGDSANMGAAVSGHAADVTGLGGSYRTDLIAADPGYDNGAGAVYVFPNYNE